MTIPDNYVSTAEYIEALERMTHNNALTAENIEDLERWIAREMECNGETREQAMRRVEDECNEDWIRSAGPEMQGLVYSLLSVL